MPGSSFAPCLPVVLQARSSIEAKRSAQDFVKLRKSKLKIGMMCTIAPHQLVELIGSLHTRYPGLELELIDASARQLSASPTTSMLSSLPDWALPDLHLYRRRWDFR